MFLARRPSADVIDGFLRRSRTLPLSYDPPGLLDRQEAGWYDDETAVVVGRGREAFDRARAALASWAQFDVGWVHVHPRRAPTTAGTVVAVLIRHLGCWSLNGARVIAEEGVGLDEDRFAVAYGTLTSHEESGEERFEVTFDRRTGDVVYRIHAKSRPGTAPTWIGQPIVRLLQARFRADSAAAMRRATSAEPAV